MSTNRVLGKNQIVEIKVSGVWYPIFCCKSMDFTQNQEPVEVTSVNSVSGREYVAGLSSSTLNVSGVTVIDNTGNQISILHLMPEAQRRTVQEMRIRLTADNTTAKQISFNALITSNNLSRTFGSYSQSASGFVVTGGITIGAVDPPGPITVDVYSDYWITTNGQNYVDGSSSGTSPSSIAFGGVFNLGALDTLLDVEVDGDHFNLITSGAPGNMECKFNTTTFVLTFATDMIFTGAERVWIEFKRTTI